MKLLLAGGDRFVGDDIRGVLEANLRSSRAAINGSV